MIYAAIIILIIAIDQFTKYLAWTNIPMGSKVTIIDGFFYLTHSRNTGAAWGIFQNGKMFLVPLTVIITMVLVWFLIKNENKLLKISLSMIIGGAVGNMIDRVFRPEGVVDFLDFFIGSYHFPTFNAADSFVVVGSILMSVYWIFIYKDQNEIKNQEASKEGRE